MSSESGHEVTYRRYNPRERRNMSGRRWQQSDSSTGHHQAGPATTYGLLKSTAGTPCRTEFVNRTDVTLRVLWLDFKGEKVEYSRMAPGGAYRGLMTYSTHPWVLEDLKGTVYAVYVGGSAAVTVHGRDNFTVVSGVQRRSSIRSRVIEKLKQSSVAEKLKQTSLADTDGGAKGKNGADVENVDVQGNATKDALKNSAGTQVVRKGTRGFLGWCVPKAEELKESDDRAVLTPEPVKAAQGCSICCETLEQDVWALACGHVFHGHCLAATCEHQMECPICRQEIAGEMDLQKIYLS